jgi:lactoylglutathione lyase
MTASTLAHPTNIQPNANLDKKVMTQGLSHVGLTVANLNKTTAFFTETLGGDLLVKNLMTPQILLQTAKFSLPFGKLLVLITRFDRKNNIGLHHLALSV